MISICKVIWKSL